MDYTQSADCFRGCPPQLDTIETTDAPSLPTCYSDYRRQGFEREFFAAEELYTDLDARDHTHHLSELRYCRSFAYFSRHVETGEVKVISSACRLRWCPVCADSKRKMIRHIVSKWIATFRRPRFMTLTMAHSCTTLQTQIDKLYRAFRLFRKFRGLKRKIRGGVWFLQLKKSDKDNLWHPHLHVVLDSNYISKYELSKDWMNATGTSYIIDIREIKNPGKVANYVSRYCAKSCNMSDYTQTDRIEIATVLHGKRLCGSFGTGVKLHSISPTLEDRTAWERLGTWFSIVNNRSHVPVFASIVKSYLRRIPIERSLCESLIRENAPDEMQPLTLHMSPSITQLYFDDFVHR